MANILIAVTGSIASYKSADLVSSLKKQGHDVTVLMTQAATEFIQPLTLQILSQNPVHLNVMKEPYPDQVNHIERGKETDLFIVVPATANTIAKLAHGFADKIISPKESLLACGDYGKGALADLNTILERIKETLDEQTL